METPCGVDTTKRQIIRVSILIKYLTIFLGLNIITEETLSNMGSIKTLIIQKLTQTFYDKMLLFGKQIIEERSVS